MTTLVTGATGFVGAAVARQLIERGDEVRVFARPGGDRRNIAGLPVEIVEGDLRDADSCRKAVAGVRRLYHIAADYRLWVRDPAEIYASNVQATEQLMRCAAETGVERIVYTSSVATLGINPDRSPADEDTPVALEDMIGHYKRSKFLAEEVVRKIVREEGLPAVIVNPSTPFGPRDVKPTPTGSIVIRVASGRMPAFVDTGLNVVHVDDVARGHLLAERHGKPGERYVLGGENMLFSQIVTTISELAGRKPPRIKLPIPLLRPVATIAEAVARRSKNWEPFVTREGLKLAERFMFFSSAKAKRELGYHWRPAEEAFQDALDWSRANGYF